MSATHYRSGLGLARAMSDCDRVRVPAPPRGRERPIVYAERERTPMPPSWVLDKIADQKLHGGYKMPTCTTCFQKHSAECPGR